VIIPEVLPLRLIQTPTDKSVIYDNRRYRNQLIYSAIPDLHPWGWLTAYLSTTTVFRLRAAA
ncbi:MAG: hypothetical protein ACREXR_21900, partial [Gammaproteobacteria bacterium]